MAGGRELHVNAVSVQNPPWDSSQRADGLEMYGKIALSWKIVEVLGV